jgi:hypothetical protein
MLSDGTASIAAGNAVAPRNGRYNVLSLETTIETMPIEIRATRAAMLCCVNIPTNSCADPKSITIEIKNILM